MSKLTVHYNSRGESGNIFWIIKAVRDECHRVGEDPTQFKDMLDRVLAAESYNEALAIIGERVNLIDDAGITYTTNHKQWVVFSDSAGKELYRMSIKGSFENEIASTIGLLAYENNIDPAEISIAFVET